MAPNIPLSLALFDVPPNLFFLLGAYWLYRRVCPSRLFALGAGLVFINGLTKAAWKLIIALGGPNIDWLSQIFVIFLSTGFLLMLIAQARVFARASRRAAYVPESGAGSPLLMIAAWKIPFMMVAAVSAIGVHLLWIITAARRKSLLTAAAFTLSMLAVIAMAGLSGGTQTLARNWLAEGVNNLGQLIFAFAAYRMSRLGTG